MILCTSPLPLLLFKLLLLNSLQQFDLLLYFLLINFILILSSNFSIFIAVQSYFILSGLLSVTISFRRGYRCSAGLSVRRGELTRWLVDWLLLLREFRFEWLADLLPEVVPILLLHLFLKLQ